MDNKPKAPSATKIIYDFLLKQEPGWQFNSVELADRLAITRGQSSGALHRIEKMGMIKAVSKYGKRLAYEYVQPIPEPKTLSGVEHKEGHGEGRKFKQINNKRKVSDFADVKLPESLTPRQRVEVTKAMAEAGLEPRKSLTEQLLDILVEVEALENENETLRKRLARLDGE